MTNSDAMKKILAHLQELQLSKVKPSPGAIILATGSGFKPPGEVDYNNNTRRFCECGSEPQWGSLSLSGIKVFSSPHLPPDTMLVIDDTPIPPMPMLTMPLNPHEPRRPEWEPDFDTLLTATHRALLTNNRGRFNTIMCVDDSPLLPDSKALVKFRNDRTKLYARLRSIFEVTLLKELRRRGKPWPTISELQNPPYLSHAESCALARKKKTKQRRRLLRSRKSTAATCD